MSGVDDLLERARVGVQLPDREERRRIRECAGLSLREFGEALGVSHAAVRRWEIDATPRDPTVRREYLRLLNGLAKLNGGSKR